MCLPLLESGRFGILEDSSFLIGCICETTETPFAYSLGLPSFSKASS